MMEEGWWIDDEFTKWQPASCMMHTYKPQELSSCLSNANIVFIGDSITRQQFYGAVQLVDPTIDTDGPRHSNRKFFAEGLTFEFWWDPYLNTTLTQKRLLGQVPGPRPSLLVVGSGAWQLRYLDDDYFEPWQAAVDQVFNAATLQPNIADALLLSPVTQPEYSVLAEERANTMTEARVNAMNEHLKSRQAQVNAGPSFGIPFVWNQVGQQASNVTEDGLHFSTVVTHIQAQLAMNFRCNNEQSKQFPLDTTCCFAYPQPRWYQLFFILMFLVWVPVGYFVISSGSASSLTHHLFPSQSVLQAMFIFGLCVMYMYFGDRTQLFGKIQKNFDPLVFTGLIVLSGIVGLLNIQKKKEGDQGFLNRHQTDEWKGWMQIIILVYHFCGASGTSGIYNPVRILVAAYLFQTGYGHFFFFYKKADFGMMRILNVMVRLNFLTFVLQYLMNTDYLSYYFTPLVSFWFLVIWVVMYVGHGWNKVPLFMMTKLVVSCIMTTFFIKKEGILEFIFDLLSTIFNIHWNPAEWRFRLSLDAYVVYIGMLCAYAFIKCNEMKLSDRPIWPRLKLAAVALSILSFMWYFWFELTRENKIVYNQSHPYISWIPILAFAVLRNATVRLRNAHSGTFAYIGKISLETFIGQFHIWLAGDTKGLLVLFPPVNWVQGLGWWFNLAISSMIFLFVCQATSTTTHEISTWLCAKANGPVEKNNTYQAVPLLPTNAQTAPTQGSKSQSENTENNEAGPNQEEGEGEWTAAPVKQPSLLNRVLSDARVRSLLFIVIVGLANRLC
jgi:hypothetical protein